MPTAFRQQKEMLLLWISSYVFALKPKNCALGDSDGRQHPLMNNAPSSCQPDIFRVYIYRRLSFEYTSMLGVSSDKDGY